MTGKHYIVWQKALFSVAQEDDVISTDVEKKGDLTHYRWCASTQKLLQMLQNHLLRPPCMYFGSLCDIQDSCLKSPDASSAICSLRCDESLIF